MGLNKSITVPGTNWKLKYHRIVEIRYFPKNHMLIILNSYPDETARRDGKQSISPNPCVSVTLITTTPVEETYTETTTDEEGNVVSTVEKSRIIQGDPVYAEDGLTGNIMDICYTLLKKDPEWIDAVDVLEEGQISLVAE